MLTKSIRLTEEEAAQLKEYTAISGEVEAAALKRAAMRGLKEMRLEQGILAFLDGRGSSEAAEVAGVPRAEFLQVLIDKGVHLLRGPSTVPEELEFLAEQFGNERLAAVARALKEDRD